MDDPQVPSYGKRRDAGTLRHPNSWRNILTEARQKPRMFLGDPTYAHLAAIRYPLRQIWEKRVWLQPLRCHLFVSPHQFVLMVESGPLAPEVDEFLDFEGCDVLRGEIWRASRNINHPKNPIRSKYGGSTIAFQSFCTGIELVSFAFLAVRSSSGLWGQAYEDGWPVMPPSLIEANTIGLISARAMDSEWFTGLPYTLEGIREIIPAVAAPNVELRWAEDDNLLPNGKSSEQWQAWIQRYLPL